MHRYPESAENFYALQAVIHFIPPNSRTHPVAQLSLHGHYAVDVKYGNIWYRINDQVVTPITDEETVFNNEDRTGYVLLYKRI